MSGPDEAGARRAGPRVSRRRTCDLDAEFVYDRYLGEADALDHFQHLLVAHAPLWSQQLVIWRSRRHQIPVALHQPEALRSEIVTAASQHGPTYQALVERYGVGPSDRLTGSAELRGGDPGLVVLVDIDELVVSLLGSGKDLGNRIAVQVRRRRVEGAEGWVWMREMFRAVCETTSPAWGAARQTAEYEAKVMSDGPSIEAVGRDFGRWLPGLFWLNYFGVRYRELLADRLEGVPADLVAPIGDGVMLSLDERPSSWSGADYRHREQEVLGQLGREFFFSKFDPPVETVVPDWSTTGHSDGPQ